MASTYTTNLRLELQGTGDNSGTWGGVANSQFTLLDKAIGGMTSVGMVDGINTLTALNGSDDQSRQPVIYLYGALTTVAYLEIPSNSKKPYYIWNNTSGNKPITVRHPVGSTGMVVPSSAISAIYSTGTSVVPLAPAVDFLGGLNTFPSTVSATLLTANGIVGTSAAWTQRITADSLRVNTSAYCSTLNVFGSATFALGARVSGAELSATSATLTNLGSTNLSATTGTFTSVATSVASATVLNGTTTSATTLTATSASITNLNVSGAFTGAGQAMAKAWATWSGSGPTIVDSYNFSGIRKIATGQYALTFTSAIPHASPVAIAGSNTACRFINSVTTTSVEVYVHNLAGAYVDATYNSVVIF